MELWKWRCHHHWSLVSFCGCKHGMCVVQYWHKPIFGIRSDHRQDYCHGWSAQGTLERTSGVHATYFSRRDHNKEQYLTDTPASKALTESLLSMIRQQRHFGVRVIISTQEPTISPRLMDLCSVTVVHRFTSPEWFAVLRRHISVEGEKRNPDEIFRQILKLRVGEALIFAPSTILRRRYGGEPERLGSSLLQIKVRKRLTWDGGKSILCFWRWWNSKL